jgi:hypothetical protein
MKFKANIANGVAVRFFLFFLISSFLISLCGGGGGGGHELIAIAIATSSSAMPGTDFTLDASQNSDSDVQPLTYQWSRNGGR